ncbi:MAG: maltooligosyltrehalose trehalohydrolase [Actinomycetota bacterium]|nr:maltooligosyltrehalose trehalohydrolase [Actinomycetota bacterium]
MAALRVWAPAATRVDAQVDDRTLPMSPDGGGWWSLENVAEGAAVGPGADYGFCIDGAAALPDPRSRWQPHGVHGLSRVVDDAAYEWRAAGWHGRPVLGRLIYELHIGTFTDEGTFGSAIERLDDLVDLGVDFVELLPVAAFPGHHGWGYDGVFLYAVHEPYGGPGGLKRFVDACHLRGLGVILDVVYNHLGPDGNVLAAYGPYFTHSYATPWGDAVNYSGPGSDEVRRFAIDNALMWLRDYRIDGLRLDAVHAIIDTSSTHLLEQLAGEVAELSGLVGRPLSLIAESDLNDPRIINAPQLGGYGVGAQWSDDFHHALHVALTGETSGYYEDFGSLSQLGTALRRGFVFAGEYSKARDRRHGQPLPPSTVGHRLLGYAQNHDQVGNRADGERLAALVSPALAKVAAALVLTSPFTPMLFMGEEWGASTPWQYFTDHEDPALAAAVSNGRREEFKAFGWRPDDVPDPQDPQTFRRSILNWDERKSPPHADLLAWHRDLIELRRARPGLRDGRFDDQDVDVDEVRRLVVVTRPSTVIAVNLSPQSQTLDVDARSVLLASADAELRDTTLTLAPESVAILER